MGSSDGSCPPQATEEAQWKDVQAKEHCATDSYLIDPTGRILGAVGPAVDFGFDAFVDRRRFGHYADKDSARAAIEREVQRLSVSGLTRRIDSRSTDDLLDAIRRAGYIAARTASGLTLLKAGVFLADLEAKATVPTLPMSQALRPEEYATARRVGIDIAAQESGIQSLQP